jgi:uncharacterized protein
MAKKNKIHYPNPSLRGFIMRTILGLFARSPFAPLQTHMEKVSACVHLLPELFLALYSNNLEKVETLANLISEKEHQADLTKNDIRNHLPKSLFLAMDRGHLLEILAIQDGIADKAEDIAVLVTLKTLPLIEPCKEEFTAFLQKNIEAFDGVFAIIRELHELLESSFGGIEAEKVVSMVEKVAVKEHEADIIQRRLLKIFFNEDKTLSPSSFHLWQRIFESIASLSNLSEKLANRIRMTLELK